MLCELQECDQSLALVAKIKVWKFCFGRLCFLWKICQTLCLTTFPVLCAPHGSKLQQQLMLQWNLIRGSVRHCVVNLSEYEGGT